MLPRLRLRLYCSSPGSCRVDGVLVTDMGIRNAAAPVLALYPDTTTFYPATVIASAKRRKGNDYVLMFDEEEEKKTIA